MGLKWTNCELDLKLRVMGRQSDQKIEQNSPNIWKYSQNRGQNIKAQIESVPNTHTQLL
jgi:hypothetical protein